jgi:Mg2+ and Co2+ transporter CorA
LINVGEQFLKLASQLEVSHHISIPKEEVQDVVHRAELHIHMLAYLERMLNSQFSYYSNLLVQEEFKSTMIISKSSKDIAAASQRDSLSMKTVSYLTMAFLPATFVSAIFSTTISISRTGILLPIYPVSLRRVGGCSSSVVLW